MAVVVIVADVVLAVDVLAVGVIGVVVVVVVVVGVRSKMRKWKCVIVKSLKFVKIIAWNVVVTYFTYLDEILCRPIVSAYCSNS